MGSTCPRPPGTLGSGQHVETSVRCTAEGAHLSFVEKSNRAEELSPDHDVRKKVDQ